MRTRFLYACILLLAAMLAIGAFAADAQTVYVATDADGTGESAESPVGSLAEAFALLDGKGGRVVLLNSIFVHSTLEIPEQSGDLTVTAEQNGRLVLTDKLLFEKNKNTNLITLDLPLTTDADGLTVYGGFNSIHFTENFVVDGVINFYGGVSAPLGSTSATDEVDPAENLAAVTDLPYSITVDNGSFRIFTGGNYRYTTSCVVGSIAGTLDITINGGTFTKEVAYTPESAIKNGYAFSLSGMSLLAGDATLTVNGGTFDTPIYIHGYLGQTGAAASVSSALTYSDPKYYAADGDVVFNINGGTFLDKCIEIGAEQTAASYNRLHRGSFTLNIGEGASLPDGIVLDATQVKAYAGGTEKAVLTCPASANVTVKRFDVVNGEPKTYDEPIRIACIGDSITEGVGASNYSGNAYPARLYSKAVAAGHDVIVSNYGSSGAKILDYEYRKYNNGLAYTLSMQETDADYIVIGLGTNDARMTTFTYGYADRFYDEYKALLAGYGALPDTDIVFNTSAIFRRDKRDIATVSNIHPLQRRAQQELAAEAAAAGEDVEYTFIDLYALTLEDMLTVNSSGSFIYLADSVHPNTAGYNVYADAILDAVFDGVTEVEGFKTSGDLWVSASGTNSTDCTEENPTSNLSIAFSRAADGATVRIVGEFDFKNMERYDWGFSTPTGIKNFSIVGEGEGAALTIDCDQFFVKGDLFMDNITLATNEPTNAYTPLHISLGYNNVTFGEGFRTLAPDDTQGGALLIAGIVTLGDDLASGWYNPRGSVSFDRDCEISILGGTYTGFVGGNYLFASYKSSGVTNPRPSLYGTYSGDMTVNIGGGVTLAENACSGAVGQNYLAGSVKLNAGAWAFGAIREYAWIGDVPETASYQPTRNTGTVEITLADGVSREIVKARDLNADGAVDLADALTAIRYVLDGTAETYNDDYYFDQSAFALADVLSILRTVVK